MLSPHTAGIYEKLGIESACPSSPWSIELLFFLVRPCPVCWRACLPAYLLAGMLDFSIACTAFYLEGLHDNKNTQQHENSTS